jgi:hypothetical protein
MLLSHTYRFIFLKTVKTASTTTEIFFEKYCLPKDFTYKEEHYRRAIITDCGIVGSRGHNNDEYYNHMDCNTIENKIGSKVYNEYFKFANIRNPFDIVVSEYFFFCESDKISFEEYVLSKDATKDCCSFNTIFHNGILKIDDTVRYENLRQDIERVARKLKINDKVVLGNYKAEYRNDKGNYRKFYNSETKAFIENIYETYLNTFNYQF